MTKKIPNGNAKNCYKENRLVVQFKGQFYDVTEFSHKHPGGVNTLNYLNGKNIEEKFHDIQHSDAALYLMKEYKLKSPKNGIDLNGNICNGNISNGNLSNGNSNANGGVKNVKLDDSLEYLVDWDEPMLEQLSKLGEKYDEWVNLPVDRPLRLFKHDFMEALTKTPWYVIPLVWLPVIFYLIYTNIMKIASDENCISIVLTRLLFGIITWTLLEYTLHRYLFHLNVKNKSIHFKVFHFLIHGLHHKVPFDPYRLVFPPFPAAILATIFYQPLRIFDYSQLLLAGGLIGYLAYDLTHYSLHYSSPRGGYFYNLKRIHNSHHFQDHEKGYGISSPFWDNIFGTTTLLRKFKYILKW